MSMVIMMISVFSPTKYNDLFITLLPGMHYSGILYMVCSNNKYFHSNTFTHNWFSSSLWLENCTNAPVEIHGVTHEEIVDIPELEYTKGIINPN